MAVKPRIDIVGGGIGGLTTALALARRGHDVCILEQADALGEVGAGLQLGPNAMAVLHDLGVGPAVLEAARAPGAVVLNDSRTGRGLTRFPLGQSIVARTGNAFVNIHRADLIDALADAARAACDILLGQRVAAVSAHQMPEIVLGTGQTRNPNIVIAADGARSAVRQTLFAGQNPQFSGHIAWRMTIDRPANWTDDVTVWLGVDRHVVVYPLRDRLLNIVAVEKRAVELTEDWRMQGDPAVLRQQFSDFPTEVRDLLAHVRQVFVWGLYAHNRLPRWSVGPVALLGDAAHPMLPFLAQGAGMAIEDAWTVADALSRSDDIPAGLASYDMRRRARVERVQRASMGNGRLYHAGGVARIGRNAGFAVLNTVARGFVERRFDWLYGVDVTKL